MNAIDILKYGQGTVIQAIENFPQEAWTTPGACGVWSVKDIIAHLTSYEHVLFDIMAGFVGTTPSQTLSRFVELGGQFNDIEVQERKERSMKSVLDEFHDVHAHVMSLAGNIPPETFQHNGTLPWYGMNYALDDVLVYMYYGHKREHSAQIAAFQDRQSQL